MPLLTDDTPPFATAEIIGQKECCEITREPYGGVQAFEHLLRLNQVNNQALFLSGFCHSFSNPINSIHMASRLLNAYVQDIIDQFDDPDYEPEFTQPSFRQEGRRILDAIPRVVQGINDSALKLNQLVSHLPEFTGSGTIATCRSVDISQLITLCISMIQYRITVSTNHFRLDLEDDLPELPGIAQQIAQVILNLVMNALLSLPDRSCAVKLSASCNRATGCIQVSVQDEGGGISPDIYPRILEPFFSTWAGHGCVGLGLTVADRIIREHGGELTIDSKPGNGTTVRVVLPLCRPDKAGDNHA